MKLTLRKGTPSDAYQIAELLHLASGGLSDFLLKDILPNCDILDLIALGVTDKKATISYSKTLVAETDKQIQGIVNFYQAKEHKIPEIMKTFIPEDRIQHLEPFFADLVPESIYLHALAVKEGSAFNSLGTILVLKTIEYAKNLNISKLSAHVWANNTKVLNVLLKKGFEIYKEIVLGDHPLLPNQERMFLLSYTIR